MYFAWTVRLDTPFFSLVTHCMQHACKQYHHLDWADSEFSFGWFWNSKFSHFQIASSTPFIRDSPVFNSTNDLQLAYALSTEKFKCIYCWLDDSVFKKYLLGLCFLFKCEWQTFFFSFWFELFSCIVSTSIAVFNNVYCCVLCGK